jgi:hypothetical protein
MYIIYFYDFLWAMHAVAMLVYWRVNFPVAEMAPELSPSQKPSLEVLDASCCCLWPFRVHFLVP